MVDKMLSSKDIEEWFYINNFNEPIIIRYRDLNRNIKQYLKKVNGYCCFVLYEKKPNVGHWTILFYDEVDDILEFFDPYGVLIDDQLDHSYYEDKEHKLTKILLDEFNDNCRGVIDGQTLLHI